MAGAVTVAVAVRAAGEEASRAALGAATPEVKGVLAMAGAWPAGGLVVACGCVSGRDSRSPVGTKAGLSSTTRRNGAEVQLNLYIA